METSDIVFDDSERCSDIVFMEDEEESFFYICMKTKSLYPFYKIGGLCEVDPIDDKCSGIRKIVHDDRYE